MVDGFTVGAVAEAFVAGDEFAFGAQPGQVVRVQRGFADDAVGGYSCAYGFTPFNGVTGFLTSAVGR